MDKSRLCKRDFDLQEPFEDILEQPMFEIVINRHGTMSKRCVSMAEPKKPKPWKLLLTKFGIGRHAKFKFFTDYELKVYGEHSEN